jgi:hypothetical protein
MVVASVLFHADLLALMIVPTISLTDQRTVTTILTTVTTILTTKVSWLGGFWAGFAHYLLKLAVCPAMAQQRRMCLSRFTYSSNGIEISYISQ